MTFTIHSFKSAFNQPALRCVVAVAVVSILPIVVKAQRLSSSGEAATYSDSDRRALSALVETFVKVQRVARVAVT